MTSAQVASSTVQMDRTDKTIAKPKPHRSETVETEASSCTKAEASLHNASDAELIAQAETLYQEEKVLAAARLLRRIQDPSQLSASHQAILNLADDFEKTIADLTGPPDEDWTKQGESRGSRPTAIYYKFDEQDYNLTCRIETPIEASLLVPLLSVLNETDLYSTWIPYNYIPRIGVQKSVKLEQAGRANQTVQIVCDVPWPLKTRDVVINAVAVDDIDEAGYVVVRMHSLMEGPVVPPVEPGVERIDFDGAFLVRACPPDHELLSHGQAEDEHKEPMLLVSFKMHLDSHLTAIPTSLVNFVTRTVIGQLWAMLLKVASGIRDGKRPAHQEAIAARADLYQWIEKRAEFMMENMTENEAERFICYLQS